MQQSAVPRPAPQAPTPAQSKDADPTLQMPYFILQFQQELEEDVFGGHGKGGNHVWLGVIDEEG